jgi:hypothetical protein
VPLVVCMVETSKAEKRNTPIRRSYRRVSSHTYLVARVARLRMDFDKSLMKELSANPTGVRGDSTPGAFYTGHVAEEESVTGSPREPWAA